MSELSNNDLQNKYQKLATEYAKLKAQVPVLKKAFVEEQTKCEQLNETVKLTNSSVRKHEQEIDSLSFRNKQLESRVQSLQQELDVAVSDKKHKRNASHAADASGVRGVIDEELQNKIAENVRLHKQMYESAQDYRRTTAELQQRVMQLQQEADKYTMTLDDVKTRANDQVEKLTTEKMALEIRLQKLDEDLRRQTEQAVNAEQKLGEVQSRLGAELKSAESVIALRLPYNDTADSSLNALNCPVHDKRYQQKLVDLMKTSLQPAMDYWLQAVCTVFTLLAHTPRPVTGNHTSVIVRELRELASRLKPVCDRMLQEFDSLCQSLSPDILSLLETTDLKPLSAQCQRLCSTLDSIQSYICFSLAEEQGVSSASASMLSQISGVLVSVRHFVCALTRLADYLTLLAQQGNPHCVHPRPHQQRMLEGVQVALTSLTLVTSDLVKHLAGKVSMEQHLPTTTSQVKAINDKLLTACAALASGTEKVCVAASTLVDHCISGPSTLTHCSALLQDHTFSPFTVTFQRRTAQYLRNIQYPSVPQSVPYEEALSNQKILHSSTEGRDALVQQVTSLQDQVRQLDQQREHWRLECQLLHMKIDKLQTRPTVSPSEVKMTTSASEASLVARLEAQVTESGSDASREEAIRQHYSSKLADVTRHLQLADSRILDIVAECHALHHHVKVIATERDHLRTELTASNQSCIALKDELETTGKSYEEQLSLMSEHLAAMNEKLSRQKDEIDALKFELTSKTSKKSKLGLR